jgi:hypothetical protein
MATFKGYSETPEDGQDFLVEGQEYEIAEVNEDESSVAVVADNPDFNPKKKANDETNPKTILVDVFFEELEEPEGEDESAPKAKGKAAPAKATGKVVPLKGKAAAEDTDNDADADADAPAPAPAKGKAAAKSTPAKAKAKGKAAPAKVKGKAAPKAEDSETADPYGDLDEESEDQEILGLVNESEDILELAKEVVEESAALEYRLGGVLFHVRKSKAYEELDNRYKEKGGFSVYLLEHLNIEYRKAMYLIDIYYKWNKFGLEPEKVAQIGWAKAAKIAAVMTEETAEELVKLAEENTVADLVENIKTSYKEVGGVKGDKKKLKLFKFKLFESQADAVEEVLASVMGAMNFKNLDEAFEHIVMEWATEHPVEAKEEKTAKRPVAQKAEGATGKAKPAGRARA